MAQKKQVIKIEKPSYFNNFTEVKNSGAKRTFKSGAFRDVKEGKGRFDLLPGYAITRLAKQFENGCKHYGDNNWKKGLPVKEYLDSGLRHFFKLLMGWTDEDHAAAVLWNVSCYIETLEMIHNGVLDKELLN